MRSVFLFSSTPDTSPIRDALAYGPYRVHTHPLADGAFVCPISAPPQLAILEPPPQAALAPLLSAMDRHPVVGRVPRLVVLDRRWLAMAARIPCADFVTRDAPPVEVLARVARLMADELAPQDTMLRFGPLTVDLAGFEARMNDAPMALTPQEFALLRYFVSHPNRAWSRAALLTHVWGQDYAGGTRTVDIHVRRLRAKLGAPSAAQLKTVRGVGYKWVSTHAAP